MPGPMPKPADRRQRVNKPHAVTGQVVAINNGDIPEPPEGLTPERLDEWDALWRSELAATWNRDFHVDPMRRLFILRQRVEAFDEEGMQKPVVHGSTGQESINPLLKEASVIRKEILAIEDRYGLSPQALMKLGIAIGQAHHSLDEMNKRIGEKAGAQPVEYDPRIAAITESA